MITITITGTEGHEREEVLKALQSGLIDCLPKINRKYRHILVLRSGAFSEAVPAMIPSITTVFKIED